MGSADLWIGVFHEDREALHLLRVGDFLAEGFGEGLEHLVQFAGVLDPSAVELIELLPG